MLSDLVSSPLQIRRRKQEGWGGFTIKQIDYNQVLTRQGGKRTAQYKAKKEFTEYSTSKAPKGTTELPHRTLTAQYNEEPEEKR